MLSDLADTYEHSTEQIDFLAFIQRAVDSVELSKIGSPKLATIIPEMLIQAVALHLWDVKTLRSQGKTIVLQDISMVLEKARHTLFMSDAQYEKLELYKKTYVEAVVAEMILHIGEDALAGSIPDPSNVVVGYKAENADGSVRWFGSAIDVFAFGKTLPEWSLGSWQVGTVFADGYTDFHGCAKSSGVSEEDFVAVWTANVFGKLQFNPQWDSDSELPFAEPVQGHAIAYSRTAPPGKQHLC